MFFGAKMPIILPQLFPSLIWKKSLKPVVYNDTTAIEIIEVITSAIMISTNENALEFRFMSFLTNICYI